LFRDPICDGAADPTVVWNPHERAWWMVYTQRRARDPENGVGWVHGTALGVASSSDHGRSWLYRGTLPGLAVDGEWGHDTFWAPEIVRVGDVFHMYVTHIRGVPTAWTGAARTIRHYVSDDLVRWTYRGTPELSSDRVIDACVHPLGGGAYRMWYKDEADGNTIWSADSGDLDTWRVNGRVLSPGMPVEGPYVFRLAGHYWLLADAKCQLLYRSDDLATWEYAGTILDAASGAASGRADDLGPGLHAQVVVAGDVGWVFYFTHPERHLTNARAADLRRSTIQAAALLPDGDGLRCVRDGTVTVDLTAAEHSPSGA
jgi:hypothetical protein